MGVDGINGLDFIDSAAVNVANVLLVAYNGPAAAHIEHFSRHDSFVIGHLGRLGGTLGKQAGLGQNFAIVKGSGVQVEIAKFRFLIGGACMEFRRFIIVLIHCIQLFHFTLFFCGNGFFRAFIRGGIFFCQHTYRQQTAGDNQCQQTLHLQKEGLLHTVSIHTNTILL